MDIEIMKVQVGDPQYEQVIGGLRADADLLAYMWQAAESRLDEHPTKVWIVAVDPNGRALAWCAYQPVGDGVVTCVNSFERPEVWGRGLYATVYAARHQLIRWFDAVTYVYDQPLPLHLADGWVPFEEGWSSEPDAPSHHWTGLRRPADPHDPERY